MAQAKTRGLHIRLLGTFACTPKLVGEGVHDLAQPELLLAYLAFHLGSPSEVAPRTTIHLAIWPEDAPLLKEDPAAKAARHSFDVLWGRVKKLLPDTCKGVLLQPRGQRGLDPSVVTTDLAELRGIVAHLEAASDEQLLQFADAARHEFLKGVAESPWITEAWREVRELCESCRGELKRRQSSGDELTSDARSVCGRIPVPLTPLIGRDKEVAELRRKLSEPGVRLLTLAGTGGVGKTHIALHVAQQVQGEFRDGVCFVELETVRDHTLVVPAIARALGVEEAVGQLPLKTVEACLAQKQCLLVLDNFEQVLEATPVVVSLLMSCPELRILVTSRTCLNGGGEKLVQVPVLSKSYREELFVQRAQAAKSDFDPIPEAATISKICARLDGLPLAIELVAAHIRACSPQQMLKAIKNRLDGPVGGATSLSKRHLSLRNTIGWSYDLLSPQGQKFIRSLAVFPSDFGVEAVDALQEDAVDAGNAQSTGGGDWAVRDAISSLATTVCFTRSRPQGQTRFAFGCWRRCASTCGSSWGTRSEWSSSGGTLVIS